MNPEREPRNNRDGNYNIIFVMVDQEHYFSRYPEGSHYRAQKLLEEMGTTFEKHYICSNMSTSSRSTIVTGQHLPHTGMFDNTDLFWQGPLDEKLTTIGDRMRGAGYYSALKGKWHMGDASILEDRKPVLTDLDGYGFSDWGGTDYIGAVQEGHRTDGKIIGEAARWLDTKGRKLNEEGHSFFLNVNMVNPHDIMNYDITGYKSPFLKLAGKPEGEPYGRSYGEDIPETWNFDISGKDVPEALRLYQHHWGLNAGIIKDPVVWKDYQDYYFNCIQDMDDNLGHLLDYLTEHHLWDNTIVVFTADHGEMHGSHGLKGKGGFLYENNVHVPLIVVHPEFKGGRRVSEITSHIDLAPTFVHMTNLPEEEKERIAQGLPGYDLMELIRDAAEAPAGRTLTDGCEAGGHDGTEPVHTRRTEALFCYEMLSMTAVNFGLGEDGKPTISLNPAARGMVRGMTTERYKFVRYFSPLDYNCPETLDELYAHNDVQLFDLQNDPQEVENLAADRDRNGALIAEMNERLNHLIRREIGDDGGLYMKKILAGLAKMAQG